MRRQSVDFAGERDCRMHSVSALSSAAIWRSLSFSTLSSAITSAIWSALFQSSHQICDSESRGGCSVFIRMLTTRLILVSQVQKQLSKFAWWRQNQKRHTLGVNRVNLGRENVRRIETLTRCITTLSYRELIGASEISHRWSVSDQAEGACAHQASRTQTDKCWSYLAWNFLPSPPRILAVEIVSKVERIRDWVHGSRAKAPSAVDEDSVRSQ